MGQTRYGFSTPIGSAGGIVDLAPYAIDTFLNEEENGILKFGIGVVKGSKPGTNIAKPVKASTAAKFEGITTNNRTTEYSVDGSLSVNKGASVGVMRYGRIYARVSDGVTPAYGDSVYMITEGDEAGYFTNAAASTETGSTDKATVAIKGRFLSVLDSTTGVAVIELFNQAQA